MDRILTYKIISDSGDRLKNAAKIACSFWNRFIVPATPIVNRLGTFTSDGYVIARAYKPYIKDGVLYGRVEFNTKYLDQFSNYEIAGTLIHELGHVLGIGWNVWSEMFHHDSGAFKDKYVEKLPELLYMFVETDYGPGTVYSHWDEERFDQELMTGLKDQYEYVLPVTIKVMKFFGHDIAEELTEKSDLGMLMREVEGLVFTRSEEVKKINLDYFEETEIWEEIYTKVGSIKE